MPFKGSCTALSVPYTKEGINFEEYRRLIRFQKENGTDARVVNGTTGEPSTMTEDEQCSIISVAVSEAGNTPVIAGIGGNNTAQCIKMANFAKKAGAKGVLCVTPYYNKCSKNGLLAHFRAVADASALPVILYNVPSRTNVNIATEVAETLSHHPNIIGIKEASGDLRQIKNTIEAVSSRMAVYSGNDDQNAEILNMGGSGVISVLSNIAPKFVKNLTELSFSGKEKDALREQQKAENLITALFCEVNPIPVKTALKEMGFNMGIFRLPLCEMEDKNKEILIKEMKNFGII